MNTDQVEGKNKQLAGSIKKMWGKLTDDEVMLYNGEQEKFFGKLQEKYGIAKQEAEKQIRKMQDAVSDAAA